MKILITILLVLICATGFPAVQLSGSAVFRGSVGLNQIAPAGASPTTRPVVETSGSGVAGGTTTCTAGATVTAGGLNRLMMISVCQGNSGGVAKTINSVAWETTTVTNTASALAGGSKTDGNFNMIDVYYIIAPVEFTSGTIRVVFATAPTISGVLYSAITNAAQTSTFGTVVTASSTTNGVNITCTTGTGQLSWATTANDANGALTITGTASPVNRVKSEGVSADQGYAIGDATASGTIIWTWTAPDNGGSIITVPINGLP